MNKEKTWKVVYYTFGFVGAVSFIDLAVVALFETSLVPTYLVAIFNPAVGLFALIVAIVAQRKLKKIQNHG